MSAPDWKQVEDQFAELPLREQMLLIERLVRRMRERAYIDPADFDSQMEAMANDPAIQRELRMLPQPPTEATATRPEEAV
jgi:hypothetical protein